MRTKPRATTDLENMKCFELYIFALLLEEIHLLLEIIGIGDVLGHHGEIITVK